MSDYSIRRQRRYDLMHQMDASSIVARAINALSAFGVTTEREAQQLLPMWLHYSEMTAEDRAAAYRHYRPGGVS